MAKRRGEGEGAGNADGAAQNADIKYNTLIALLYDISGCAHEAQVLIRELRDADRDTDAAAEGLVALAEVRILVAEAIETLRIGSPLQMAALRREERRRQKRRRNSNE